MPESFSVDNFMTPLDSEEIVRLSAQINSAIGKIDRSTADHARPSGPSRMSFHEQSRLEIFYANYDIHRAVRAIAKANKTLIDAEYRLRCAEEVKKTLEAQGLTYSPSDRPSAVEISELASKIDALVVPMLEATK